MKKSLRGAIVAIFTALTFSICVRAQDAERGGVNMKLTCPDFQHNSNIPAKFTCEGDDVNPELVIEGVPEGTESLALIVDDPDAPMGTWVHWVVYDIAVASRIEENNIPGKEGPNDSGRKAYHGPCPPSGTHRYFFKLYALDKKIDKDGLDKEALERTMQGHVLASAELIGLYKRKR